MNIKSGIEGRVAITIEYLERMIGHREDYLDSLRKIYSYKSEDGRLQAILEARFKYIQQEIETMKFTIQSLKGEF